MMPFSVVYLAHRFCRLFLKEGCEVWRFSLFEQLLFVHIVVFADESFQATDCPERVAMVLGHLFLFEISSQFLPQPIPVEPSKRFWLTSARIDFVIGIEILREWSEE